MTDKTKKQGRAKLLADLAVQITGMFEKFNEERSTQLSEIKALKERIYGLRQGIDAGWASDLELPDLWEQCQTMKAHIIDILYSHPEGLFDVSSVNPKNAELAIKQKAALVSAFEEMNLREQIEKIVDSIVETGECTLFIGWENRQKAVRRWSETAQGYRVNHKTVFDGATVKTIAPQDFVFDVSRVANWESCPKIYRAYLDLDELKSNPHNVFENSVIENELLEGVLRSLRGGGNSTLKGFKDGLVEVLEFWGDIRVPVSEAANPSSYGSRVLKNQLIVVAGRRAVIRFEDNPYINSPFIYANLIENPLTKRGVSPLKPILALNSVASSILNKQLDAYSLVVNPPYLAPKGAFKGEQAVSPGKIIEYDSSLLPQMPVPLNFSPALAGWDFIQYFKSAIESATGVYRTMGGAMAHGARTATETLQSANGQSARINLVIDSINRKIILPMVQKVGDTVANFMCGAGDNELHTCEYIYRYSDRKASYERRYREREIAETIVQFSKISEFSGKINWNECFKFALEQLGVENTDMFLVSQGIDVQGAAAAVPVEFGGPG